MGKFVTTEEVRGSVAEKASQLTEREKRVAPAEHTLVDPRTGEAVRAQLNPDTVGQVMRGELKLSSGDRYRVRARDGATYELGGEEAQRTLEEGGTPEPEVLGKVIDAVRRL